MSIEALIPLEPIQSFKPHLLPMNGSYSNSFPPGVRTLSSENNGAILSNIVPLFLRAPGEKITSNRTAFIGSKWGFKRLIQLFEIRRQPQQSDFCERPRILKKKMNRLNECHKYLKSP
jgi:hypothetical protein